MALKFSDNCGENICVQNGEAEWNSVYSGGICFSDQPLGTVPLHLRIHGSSHVIIGYLEKNPSEYRPRQVFTQFIRTTDVRVHKSTFTLSLKLSTDGRHLHIDGNNSGSECFDVSGSNVWLVVYLQFGSAYVYIESSKAIFSSHKGNNIELSEGNRKATLINPNPEALCYIETPLRHGAGVNLRINPVTDPVKVKTNSLPSRFYIRIGYYLCKVGNHRLSTKHQKPEEIFADWVPVCSLEKTKCLGNLQLGFSASGCFSFASESGENGSFRVPGYNDKTDLICVLELFRVRAKALEKIRLPVYDDPVACKDTYKPLSSKDENEYLSLCDSASNSSSTLSVNDDTKAKQIENEDGSFTRPQLDGLNFYGTGRNKDETPLKRCFSNGSSPAEKEVTFSKQVFVDRDSSEATLFCGNNSNLLSTESVTSGDGSAEHHVKTDCNNESCVYQAAYDSSSNLNNLTEPDIMNIPVSASETNENVCTCKFSSSEDERNRKDYKLRVELDREVVDLTNKIKILEEENKYLKSENLRLQGELTFAENEIREKEIDRPISPNGCSISVRFYTAIQNNLVRFVNDLEIPELCDHLFQAHQISIHDYEDLQQLSKQSRREANRHMLTLVRKRAIPCDIFVSALSKTKQEGLVGLFSACRDSIHS